MSLFRFLVILFQRYTAFDFLIAVIGALNIAIFFRKAEAEADILYRHFNRTDGLSSLQEDARKRVEAVGGAETKLSPQELLRRREQMNKYYSSFSIITTMFPLFGMLGTVMALIPMVSTIGAEDTSLFFGALTSTFWGILFALICKILDTRINYKIEDNEKHLEYLLNPKR